MGGAAVFAVLSIPLLRRVWGHTGRVAALAVFSFACVFLLSMSGVYHLLAKGGLTSEVLRRLDHAGIFLLIAGSFIAVHGLLFRGFWRWGMISGISLMAVVGIVLKAAFINSLPEGLSLAAYISLGWFGAVTGFLLWKREGLKFISLLLWGAFFYTAGALIDFAKFEPLIRGWIGPHEIFHVFVIAGIACHWKFIYRAAGRDVRGTAY